MKNVLCCGSFDMLHYGHIEFLRRAKSFGDRLTVGLCSDESNVERKGRHCFYTYDQRKMMLEAVRYVDLVVPENTMEDKIKLVKELNIDVYVDGEHQFDAEKGIGNFDYLKDYCEVIYLPRTPDISTTEILLKKNLNDLQVRK